MIPLHTGPGVFLHAEDWHDQAHNHPRLWRWQALQRARPPVDRVVSSMYHMRPSANGFLGEAHGDTNILAGNLTGVLFRDTGASWMA